MKNTLIILLFFLSFTAFAGNNKADKTKEAKAREWIKNQPLEFVENKGQFMRTDGKAADEVFFKTSFGGCDIYITDKGLSYVFVKFEEAGSPKSEVRREEREDPKLKFRERKEGENKKVSYYRLDMNLEGASISKNNIIKENESKQGHSNYFYAHCPEGIYDVKAYSKITIKNIYKGIDWVIYTSSDSKEHPLKYDFVVHPEADYKDIMIKFENVQSTSLSDNNTKLKIQTIAGNIEEGNLFSYLKNEKLKMNNEKLEVRSKYVIDKDSIICFEIAEYDTTKTLVIDPLVWATYYGGNGADYASSIIIDSQDNIYVSGETASNNFPIQQYTGAYWQNVSGSSLLDDAFIVKFNNIGVRQWATYYGGSKDDGINAACFDSNNNLYITGSTQSGNFPVQQLAGAYNQNGYSQGCLVFILKFNSFGQRLWATCYGSTQYNSSAFGTSICTDSHDNLYVGGICGVDFPTLQSTGAYWQSPIADNADAFILKFNNLGVRLWATLYGGTGGDNAYFILADSQDNIYLLGQTSSIDLPLKQQTGAYWQSINHISSSGGDCFIAEFNNNGVLKWATYYGGTDYDEIFGVCIDNFDNLFLCGRTFSTDFPIQQLNGSYWQPNLNGVVDGFIVKFNNQGVRKWATFYGGSNGEIFYSIKNDNLNDIYLLGETFSLDFPLQKLACEYFDSINQDESIFIVKFDNHGNRKWATYYESGNLNYNIRGNIDINSQNSVLFLISSAYYIGDLTIDYGNGAYYQDLCYHDCLIIRLDPLKSYQPVSISSNRNNFCINEYDNITLSAIGDYIDTLKWYSDGCDSNLIGLTNPLMIPSPTQTTTYYAKWKTPCDSLICDSIKIFVKNCGSIWYFPNSFTPSGDGLNEVFKIETLAEFTNFKLLIFNRWGEQIFESNDKNKGWDGNFNGKKAPFGVYVYKFSGSIVDSNEQLNKTGRVTLIR